MTEQQKPKIGTEAFLECCNRIVKHCSDAYAVAYAKHGRLMVSRGDEYKAMQVQALYILSNLAHWRGDEAKLVKALLREFTK